MSTALAVRQPNQCCCRGLLQRTRSTRSVWCACVFGPIYMLRNMVGLSVGVTHVSFLPAFLPMFSSTLEWSSSLCLLGVDTHEPIAFHCKIAHFSLPREINSKPVFGERFTRLRLGGVVKKQFPQEWQPLHAECLRSTLQG